VTDSHAERRAALIAAGLAVPLVVLTILVVFDFEPLITFDTEVVDSWHGAIVDTGWRDFFKAVASISQPAIVTLVLVAIAALFALRREARTAIWVASVAVLAQPSYNIYKQLVQRDRPDVPDQLTTHSFPSGHATSIAALVGVLLVLCHQRIRRRRLRQSVMAALVGVGLLVGVDRIFLAAHFPSDVVAGWLLGALIVFVTATVLGIVSTDLAPPLERPLSSMPINRTTLAIVFNPLKIDDADAFKVRVGSAARAAGWDEPLWFETTVDDAGASMARAAVAAGSDVVIAAGGDGTVRVVCSEMAGTGVPVGVIPVGTGNLLARNLAIPLTLDQALDVVLHGQDRAIDMVRIDGDGLEPTRFVVMAGLGLDAAIMSGAPDALKAKLGWTAYVVAGARQLRYPAVRVDISMDGGEPVRRRARTVVIGNVGFLQAGIPLLPDAELDDGLLDVVAVAPRRFLGWVPVAARVMTKRRRTDERLDRFTGRRVVIRAAHETPRQLDGDTVAAGTELRAEVEPGVLLVRVPR
jgi:diacylglycerol kinase family enzyme/membrane-associated phospholipid phosphatase